MKRLHEYLKENKIKFEPIDDDFVLINGEKYFIVLPNDEGKLFSEEFMLMTGVEDCVKYVYFFGGNWYWEEEVDLEKPKLNELRYIGKSTSEISTHSFLGIRDGYEILNGSRLAEDWVAKAKFLGCTTLGVCEKNTLAGALKFQIECKKAGIKPIIGATYTIFREKDDFKYDVKVYAENEVGWQNLLSLNKEVNVINNKFVVEDRLFELLEGLYLIVDPKSILFADLNSKLVRNMDFYQFDTVEYVIDEIDQEYLLNLKAFKESDLRPIAITDAFYLDKCDSRAKKILNSISGNREHEATNQYFKDKEDYFEELNSLFKISDDSIWDIYTEALKNEAELVKDCNFAIETSTFHLPDYILTDKQLESFKDKEDLFWFLIERGLKDKLEFPELIDQYRDRVNLEYSVITKGDKLIDYFLILWDIIDWCDNNNILVGWGRGSSGGSLIAYLLNITNVDPIKYNLLFERFLNENRVKKSLPDIDTDFEGLRKDDIKAYMESRFGKAQVCSVGTYGNLKLKMLFSDLARIQSLPIQEVKMTTAVLDDCEKDGAEWNEIFYLSAGSSRLKSFVHKYPDIINDSKLCLMQPRSSSIHACATIIVPNSKEIFEWIPVKTESNRSGEKILVSEWEGIQLDSAGFLKEDILGILQLDKIANCMKLIKENRGISIDFRKIPLEDRKTFLYFHKGYNSDVFQFGTKGLKKYTKALRPDTIDELSACNALYRPGAMKSNAHNDFVDIKFGRKEIEYDYMLEDVTKDTYGLYIYQEQTMLAAKVLGGFSLVEADMMRKVMLGRGKKQQADQFYIYHDKFLAGAQANGCDKEKAEEIWNKLEAFAGYGFNKSHAVAYGILGYISQWFKVNYPIEFWSTALKFAKESEIPDYISEINKTGDIKLVPVDINKSKEETHTDFNKNTIYWSLIAIKQCAEKSVNQIIEDRDKNGQYFSLEEFLVRHKFKGSGVNKSVIENLITSGAFDEIENITNPAERTALIDSYRHLHKVKVDPAKDIFTVNRGKLHNDWWWCLQQKRLSGIAFFDYDDILDQYFNDDNYSAISMDDFQLEAYAENRKKAKIAGYIVEVEEKTNKKGKWCKILIESNFVFASVIIWAEQYKKLDKLNLVDKAKSLILINGQINFDSYRNENILVSCNDTKVTILD